MYFSEMLVQNMAKKKTSSGERHVGSIVAPVYLKHIYMKQMYANKLEAFKLAWTSLYSITGVMRLFPELQKC